MKTRDETLREFVGHKTRVRVWDAQHATMFVEGEVVAYCSGPMICVRDGDGVQHWHATSLPIETAAWQEL